jgi:hypothetical protein
LTIHYSRVGKKPFPPPLFHLPREYDHRNPKVSLTSYPAGPFKLFDFKLEFVFLTDGDSLPPSPPLTPRGQLEENSEEEDNPKSDSEGEEQLQSVMYNPQIMVGNNQNPPPYETWLVLDIVVIPGQLHDMPKHPEKFLPKFDPNKKYFAEDHVKKFISAIRLQNVRHEDVVCHFFSHTFENKSSTWILSLE